MEEYQRNKRVMVSLSPELYSKTMQVAEMMGLSDSAAVRYLMMRGLEGYMMLIASTSSAQMLSSFMQLVEKEVDEQHAERREKRAAKKEDAASVVPVTPRYSPKNRTPGGGKGHHD